MVVDNQVYNNLIRKYNTILKYSFQSIEAWEKLCKKNLPYVNNPIRYEKLSIIEKKIHKFCISKIEIPYLKDYFMLYNNPFIKYLNDIEILTLLKQMLLSLQDMHKNGVYHGDIFSKNIMMDKEMNFSFIDLDASIIDNIISQDNTYYEDKVSLEEKKSMTIDDDKIGIVKMFLYYFINGNFNSGISYDINIKNLGLPHYLEREINWFINGSIDIDDYFIETTEELINIGYEKPKQKKL